MKRLLGFKPEYYSRNGFECIAAYLDDRDGTVQLVMKRPRNYNKTRFEYGVWVGCNAESGETNSGHLTRMFDTKAAAIQYAKFHSGLSKINPLEVA